MSGITQSQIRKIYALCRGLAIDDDLLHEHIYACTKKKSVKELNIAEAIKVIDSLSGKKPAGEAASYRQLSYIKSLMKQLGWVTESGVPDMARLSGLCKKMYKIESYRWLDVKSASGIIEALKELIERKETEESVCELMYTPGTILTEG